MTYSVLYEVSSGRILDVAGAGHEWPVAMQTQAGVAVATVRAGEMTAQQLMSDRVRYLDGQIHWEV